MSNLPILRSGSWADAFKPIHKRDVVKELTEAPDIVPVGAVSKTIIKRGGLLLGGAIGAIGAAAFLGGKSQEQEAKQDISVIPKQTTSAEQRQKQIADFKARMTARLRAIVQARQEVDAPITTAQDVGAGVIFRDISGAVDYRPTTITYAKGAAPTQGISQDLLAGILQSQAQLAQAQQVPSQITTVTPSIQQGQTSADMGLLAIAAAAIVIFGAE